MTEATPRRTARLARGPLLVLAALMLAGIESFAALFAPSAELWPRWQAHDPASTARIDHGAWSRLLAARVSPGADGIARFAYAAVTAEERAALDGYLEGLAAQPISRFSRDEQFAYWLNLYNALTVRAVLDHYPVETIRDIDISPGLFADGPWGAELITVEGEALTLDDIEHRILRPIWQDPRIHYAVNCAALGCPDLLSEAFTAASADALMTAAARAFVNHPRGVRVVDGTAEVSSIYAWFAEDFGGGTPGILAHLRAFADPPLRAALEGVTVISDHDYDWALND